MGRISNEEKIYFMQKIKPYREKINEISARGKKIFLSMQNVHTTESPAFKRLTLADEMLNLTSYYIAISMVSQQRLKIREENALNDGRKSLYKSVIYVEQAVGNYIDAPFTDYEEKLADIAAVSAEGRYRLMQKMGLSIDLLKDAYGDNTKWRWSFVELEGRFAATAKNIVDLRSALANTDPRSPDYDPTIYHLRMIKKLLNQAADRYREKYELSTNRIDDFKLGITFLGALRRFYMNLGERDEAEAVKKKQEVWAAKLEADIKRGDEMPKVK